MNVVIQFTPIRSKIITLLPETINDQLFEFLSFKGKNYFFSSKYQERKWDGVTRLYNKKNQTFRSGFILKVAYFLQNLGMYVEVLGYPPPREFFRKRLAFELRPYQIDVVNSILKYRYGIIVSPPRSGKTLISAAVFDSIDAFPSIFYCRSIDLAIQTYQKFSIGEPTKNILPYLPGIKVGIVGDGKFELGDINIVTIQSAFSAYNERFPDKVDHIEQEVVNKSDLRAIISSAKVVFMDECHEIGGKTSRFILEKSSMDALLKIGLTATPDEGEAEDIRLEEHLGPVIHRVGYSTLIDAGYLLKPIIYMYKLPKITIDGNYQTAYKKGVIENQFLNYLVKKIVKTLVESGHSVVIQTEYRNHTEKLAKFLDVPHLMGQESGDKRAKVLQDLRDKKIMCLVSTVVEQGNDIGSLGFTINLCGQKKRRITIQRMRSTTKVEGKTVCGVIDFIHQCSYLKEHSNKRLQIYKSEPAFEIHIRDVSKKTIEDLI
jgi:superfamily II DNA or RNA helicase